MAPPVPVPACFHLAADVFPAVRAETARRLSASGWTQTRIADRLGVSQAMVSRYLAGALSAADRDRRAGPDAALVLRLAEEVVTGIDTPLTPAPPAWCTTLHLAQARPTADALSDLLAAEARLLQAAPVAVVPKIGMNLARLLPAAEAAPGGDGAARDALSYPGRIVAVGDRLVPPAPPEPRASGHLVTCLRAFARHVPGVVAAASIRGGTDVRAVARRTGKVLDLKGDGADRAALLEAALAGRPCHAVHDPGAFGIEPCLYLAAGSATELADRILAIAQGLRP